MTDTEKLEDIQDRILESLHAGEPVDQDAELATYPAYREELVRFFSVLDVIEAAPDETEVVPARLGEFRIVGEIGRGGMGVVYEAEQASLKRRVALKVLPATLGRDERLVRRFRREAQAAAGLRHKNLVPVFSVGDAAGTPFFAMELVEGRPLSEVIAERRDGRDAGLPAAGPGWRGWALDTVLAIAEALAYAHGKGILHRDVKPGNILIDADGTPRLTDFGLALDLTESSLTRSGEIFGSPRYMSPEQAVREEEPLDQRTDVYSLAVTLYELLTLKLPYAATSTMEILGALTEGKIVAPSRVDAEIPPALEKVLVRALSRRPSDRYRTMAAFASDLRAAAEDRPIDRATRRPAKAPALRIVAAAVAIMLLAYGATKLLESIDERRGRVEIPDGTPSASLIRSLALGEVENGAEVLKEWVRPAFVARRVVARNHEASYRARLTFPNPGGLDDDTLLVMKWEISVEGGPFRHLGSPESRFHAYTPQPSRNSEDGYAFHGDLRQDFGDLLAKDTVTIRLRPTVQVVRKPAGYPDSGPPPAEAGTSCSFTLRRTVLVYDDYPDDFPERMSSESIDARMVPALTPSMLELVNVIGTADDKRWLQARIYRKGDAADRRLPTNAALEVDLYAGGTRLGTAQQYLEMDMSRRGGSVVVVDFAMFELRPEPSEEEKRLLLDLGASKSCEVRLVYRASRDVALDRPSCDVFWEGGFETTTALHPESSVGPIGPDDGR